MRLWEVVVILINKYLLWSVQSRVYTLQKSGRGALVALTVEPRQRARRVLLVIGGSCRDKIGHPSVATDDILSTVLKFDLHKR